MFVYDLVALLIQPSSCDLPVIPLLPVAFQSFAFSTQWSHNSMLQSNQLMLWSISKIANISMVSED